MLDDGLATARRAAGLTFIAIRAPLAPAAALVAAWPNRALVAWSQRADVHHSGEPRTIVGIGIARELRGRGRERWNTIIDGARALAGANVVGELEYANLVRPRWLGGAAFAPGTADRAPWQGFGDAWFVLPRWTYVHDDHDAFLVLAVDADEARDIDRWQRELAIHRVALASPFVPVSQPDGFDVTRGSGELWRAQVEAITSAIANDEYAKIVAARTCIVTLLAAVRCADLLATLDARHADCVRMVVRPPDGGTLVAASPERLVRRNGTAIHCDALAGTSRSDATELLASAKDRREHALVVEAIRDALEAAGATVEPCSEPIIRALRHVLHLHTPIRATSPTPPHVLDLVARLHPTPAVGGTPTAPAIDWIREHEPVARGWYASPVGWFDLEGNGEFAVAIRSGVLVGNRAHLWAGAGIVAGSDPDRELAETELKLRAMLGALGVARPTVATGAVS